MYHFCVVLCRFTSYINLPDVTSLFRTTDQSQIRPSCEEVRDRVDQCEHGHTCTENEQEALRLTSSQETQDTIDHREGSHRMDHRDN